MERNAREPMYVDPNREAEAYNARADALRKIAREADSITENEQLCSKRGPKTDPNAPHNRAIRDVADRIVAEGGEIIAGGGRAHEQLIRTPRGEKSGRHPDIIYRDSNGKIRAVNVGKTNSQGLPIKREQDALTDLLINGLMPTEFIEYK